MLDRRERVALVTDAWALVTAGALPAARTALRSVDHGGTILFFAVPKPGETVIDGCAGAGGKSLHMAALMANSGSIVAIDTDEKRLRELERRARRAGVDIITAIPAVNILPANLAAMADLVLIDAPCSGSGTIRRNPAFKWSITESLVEHYATAQAEILARNAAYVNPGGRLAYATCSLFREENEAVIEAFLAAHPEFRMRPLGPAAAELGLNIETDSLTLYPHRSRTDGFFLAVMDRQP